MTSYTNTELAVAIFTVNKHAKTAPDNRFLYSLKRQAIEKLLVENRAKKIGLHFVHHPKFSQKRSSVLIQCADYYFHMLPSKEDFQTLPHLGSLDDQFRNPKQHMNLKEAKRMLSKFIGMPLPVEEM